MPDDDLNPNSGTHDEKENPSETPLPQSSPASIPTANPERKPADHKKARLFTRIWRIHRKRQRRVSPPNVAEKITVFLILVTAGIGGIQARIYHQQKKIMESSGHQTDQLIAYAKAQACAAKSFAASAAAINTGIGDAVGKLNLQADKLEKSVRQAARLAKATEEANSNAANADRPWIGAFFSVSNFESGKAPTYTVTYINSGRRPAKVDLTANQSGPYVVFPKEPQYSFDMVPSTSVIVPNQPSISTWTGKDTDFAAATTPGQVFYVYAKAEYRDARDNSPYWTHVCWRYLPKAGTSDARWANCSEYNDAN